MGDRIVGRCDLKTDRDAGVLRVLSAFTEDHADIDQVGPAMADELLKMTQLVGVDHVAVDAPGPLAKAIAANL